MWEAWTVLCLWLRTGEQSGPAWWLRISTCFLSSSQAQCSTLTPEDTWPPRLPSGDRTCVPTPGWERSKSRPLASLLIVPSGCFLSPPQLPPDLNTWSSSKTKKNNNKQKRTHFCHLRDFSQFSPGRKELLVSFSEATRAGPACNLHIPVVLHQPGVALEGATLVLSACPWEWGPCSPDTRGMILCAI